jgi:integrase/recombinase XerD
VPDRHQHRTLWPHHVSRRLPIILSKEEVRRLLRAALALPEGPGSKGRRETFFTILLLLYTAGLRRSEAARLRIGDVDLDAGTLLVRETKFFKTRLVPVAADVCKRLRRYMETMRLLQTQATAAQPLFQRNGRGYSAATLTQTGAKLLRICGLKPERGPGGARVHDLRATFAVHRIASWYAQGADVQSRLPALATYMGHKNIISTQRYVAVTGELLKHAAGRFETACAPREEG